MVTGAFLSIAATLLAVPALAHAGTSEATPGFTIDKSGVMANGTGCPQGTVQALVSPDQKALTIAFSAYTALTGPSGTMSARRVACTTTIPVRIPPGFTWGVATATYRGYAELYGKVKAYQGATYYFQGSTSSILERKLVPKSDGSWEITDKAGVVAWAPCKTQSNLVVTSYLKTDPGSSKPKVDSFVTMDTQDISIDSQNDPGMVFGIQVKKC